MAYFAAHTSAALPCTTNDPRLVTAKTKPWIVGMIKNIVKILVFGFHPEPCIRTHGVFSCA